MRRVLFFAANLLAGVVLVLLVVNPTQDLAIVATLLSAATIVAWVLPHFLQRGK
jgi:hypothetical protein